MGVSEDHIISGVDSVNMEFFPKPLGLVTPSPLRMPCVDSSHSKNCEYSSGLTSVTTAEGTGVCWSPCWVCKECVW